MVTQSQLAERQRIDIGLAPQSLTADTPVEGPFYSMKNMFRVLAVAQLADVSDTETLKVQLRQATDAAGTGAKDLGEAVTVASSDTPSDLIAKAEALVEELDHENGFHYVGVEVESSEAKVGGAILIREGSYKPS